MPLGYSKPIGLVLWLKCYPDTNYCYVLSHTKQPYPFTDMVHTDTNDLHTLNYYFKNSNMV